MLFVQRWSPSLVAFSAPSDVLSLAFWPRRCASWHAPFWHRMEPSRLLCAQWETLFSPGHDFATETLQVAQNFLEGDLECIFVHADGLAAEFVQLTLVTKHDCGGGHGNQTEAVAVQCLCVVKPVLSQPGEWDWQRRVWFYRKGFWGLALHGNFDCCVRARSGF